MNTIFSHGYNNISTINTYYCNKMMIFKQRNILQIEKDYLTHSMNNNYTLNPKN